MKRCLSILAASFLATVAIACGSEERSPVELRWQSDATNAEVGVARSTAAGIETVVIVTNNTGTVLRDARLVFETDRLRVPYGFSIDTVTPLASAFEGDNQVWSLGDVEPGVSIALKVSLWFRAASERGIPDRIDLGMELESADLATPLVSEPLTLYLSPSR